ncbi:DUF4382 domain-containing protein [Flavobacterium sp. IMCC34852]|uniref:DUF4382 domain-containing protein n=1 Tax=Flavobacterium rivulicola TaxID=2732161 RepID=A0A7Y3R7S8_9FLAO|nr:DUF4382 domain-containing protein [Flavobacterium sp. IMCC34852]NNT71504.1 DUF4382 domain-containing protein [Flavobacterium sp. IMCC34852]
MKKLKKLLGIITLVIVLASCSNDSGSSENTLNIVARATYSPSANRSALNGDVVLNSFKINLREIEFELAENSSDDDDSNGDSDDDGFYDSDDEFELYGPFELDLLNQNAPVTTVTVPNGTYEEVEFKLHKSTNSASAMFNKSIEITGTINGTPFIFWHDIDEDFEIDYEDTNQNLVINNNSYDLVFNFDLNQVLSMVDLSSAVDGDGDGVIEIGPNDTDGNQALANLIEDSIEDSCDLDD